MKTYGHVWPTVTSSDRAHCYTSGARKPRTLTLTLSSLCFFDAFDLKRAIALDSTAYYYAASIKQVTESPFPRHFKEKDRQIFA